MTKLRLQVTLVKSDDMKTDESRITGDAIDAVAANFAALKDLPLAGNLYEASNRDRGGRGVVYGFSIVDKPVIDATIEIFSSLPAVIDAAAAKAKARADSQPDLRKCEDCTTKRPGFGLEDELKNRWCSGCAKSPPGAARLDQSRQYIHSRRRSRPARQKNV